MPSDPDARPIRPPTGHGSAEDEPSVPGGRDHVTRRATGVALGSREVDDDVGSGGRRRCGAAALVVASVVALAVIGSLAFGRGDGSEGVASPSADAQHSTGSVLPTPLNGDRLAPGEALFGMVAAGDGRGWVVTRGTRGSDDWVIYGFSGDQGARKVAELPLMGIAQVVGAGDSLVVAGVRCLDGTLTEGCEAVVELRVLDPDGG